MEVKSTLATQLYRRITGLVYRIITRQMLAALQGEAEDAALPCRTLTTYIYACTVNKI